MDQDGIVLNDSSATWLPLYVRGAEIVAVQSVATSSSAKSFWLKLTSKKIIPIIMKYIKFFLIVLFIISLCSCNERRPIGRNADARYIEDSSEQGLVNLGKINSQDFTRAANKLIGDLFVTNALAKAPNQPAVLHVGEIRNDTQTYFDTDLLIQAMKKDLLASGRVQFPQQGGGKRRV